MKLLLIEDNPDIVENVFDYFELKGHTMDSAPNGLTGLHLAATNDYDAILLDLTLPGIDGTEICRKLRQEARSEVPILMITARDTLENKLSGFSAGADDYLVKPIALPEVEARILALLRRVRHEVTAAVLRVGDLVFDPQTLRVTRRGAEIPLNPTTRHILRLLMSESPRIVSRSRIERELWGEDPPDSDALRTHMYNLRAAIDRPFGSNMLKTVPREGYRLTNDND